MHVVNNEYSKKNSFKVVKRVGGSFSKPADIELEIDVICSQINIDKTNYTGIPKSYFENGLRDDLYVGLTIFIDDQKPTKYLIPSTVWNTSSLLFTESVKHNEYGISLNRKTIQELQGNYSFESMITKF